MERKNAVSLAGRLWRKRFESKSEHTSFLSPTRLSFNPDLVLLESPGLCHQASRTDLIAGLPKYSYPRARGYDYKLVRKQCFPTAREHVQSFMERRKEIVFGERKYELHGQWSADDDQDFAQNIVHHLLQTSKCEKSEMGSIEDAAVHVVEPSEQNAEPNNNVRDVGDGNDNFA